jgi:hypothetical protein
MGIRNRIINGHMMIDQRAAGGSFTPTSTTSRTYGTCDRWGTYITVASKFTIQQNAGSVTPPAGFVNYLGITSSSAYSTVSSDLNLLQQPIEGFNFADLNFGSSNAKTVTISFWVYSSLTGTFGGSLANFSASRFYPFVYTINSANTWQYITITIPGDTTGTWVGATNSVGAYLNFHISVGSTNSAAPGSWTSSTGWGANGATNITSVNGATFYVTGVQFEKGSVATPFDFRLYGKELLMCQRYYAKSYAQGTVPGTASIYNGALQSYVGTGSSGASLPFRFPVSMRAVPTITFYDLAGTSGKVYANGNGVTPDAQTSYYGTDGAYFGQTSVTSGGVQLLAQYTASAEL